MHSKSGLGSELLLFLCCFLSLAIVTLLGVMNEENNILAQGQEIKNYSYFLKWGSFGRGDGQFLSPHGIVVDSVGNVYVSDRDRNDIQKFNNNGTFIKKWGNSGIGPGEFNHPYEIRIDSFDNVYVVDKFNNRIQIFDTNGTFLRMHDTVGISNNTFNAPEALTVDPVSGVMYIADTGNNRVVKISNSFELIKEWGKNGTAPGEFIHPHGIDLDSSGNVFVNEVQPRIQKFDSDGDFINQWGEAGDGPGQFSAHLEHLFIDSSDNVWQVDGEENSRVVKFDNDGNFITSVGSGPCAIEEGVRSDKTKMSGPLPCDGKLYGPEHATVDLSGNLLVVDRFNYRIVGYKPSPMEESTGKTQQDLTTRSSSNISSCWSTGKSMPTERIEMASSTIGNKIFIIGGYSDKTTNIVEVYDSTKNEWSNTTYLPVKLDHLAAATYNNKLYVVGGFDAESKPSNRLFVYDPVMGKWEERKEMPTARGALTAEFVNGIMYVVGGDEDPSHITGAYHPYGQVTTNEAYDPTSDSWAEKAPMPTARHHHVSAVVDEKLYIIGGRYGLSYADHNFNNSNTNEMYDPAQNKWSNLKSIPTSRSGAAAATVNGSIYVLGGETKNYPSGTDYTYSENEKYEPLVNSWTRAESMPSGKHGLAAESISNKIYVIGGGKYPGFTVDNGNEIYHVSLKGENNCV